MGAGVGACVGLDDGAGVGTHEPIPTEMHEPGGPGPVQQAPLLFPEQSEAQPEPWHCPSNCSTHAMLLLFPREPAVGVGGGEGAGVGGVGGGVGGDGVGGGVGDSAAFVERTGQVVPIEFWPILSQ